MERPKELKLMANTIRQDIIRLLMESKSGHSAGPLGMADIFTVLYFDFLHILPDEPEAAERDYLFLSNGHICPVLYATMARRGFFPVAELMTFRKLGSRLQGHPHRESLPGIESSSGPLGSGLSQACGLALSLRLDKKKNRVICLTSDGEHDEGNTWEAVLFAAKYHLPIIQIMDRNNIQIDGPTDTIMPLNPLGDKYRAHNWRVLEIDGNNVKDIQAALQKADQLTRDGPVIIIAKTIPGKGVSFMENDYTWHGKPPNAEQGERALQELERARRGWFL